MALGGFSIHFPEVSSQLGFNNWLNVLECFQESDELLAGAPGVFNFVGSVFRIRNLNESRQNWTYQEVDAVGNYYEHSGELRS